MEVSIREDSLSKNASIVIGVVALLQGLALFWLHNALENKIWPHGDWTATMVFGVFFISLPTSIVMTYRDNYSPKRYWGWVVGMGLTFLWIAWYSASTSHDKHVFREGFYLIPLCFLLGFISLFFVKAWMRDGHWPPSYESQFGFSWHNFLSFVLAWIFTFVFWLILLLWGALFNIVEIGLFKEIFAEKWFLYPVLSLAFAYAVVIFRTKINAVGAVQRILRALISILLPLLLTIAVMFVAVLPFTGVSLIWEKGYGSDTIIGFIGLSLFFFNAVYQDGKQAPYSELVNTGVKFAMVVLNALLGLAAYGVYLRISQYGLTVERIMAIILVVLMFGYVGLYSLIIIFKRNTWSEYFGKANTMMAVLVSIVIVLLFTPVLDMSRLSVDSQLRRLNNGDVAIQEFDFHHLAGNGNYGLAKLEELKQRSDVTMDASLVKRVQTAIDKKGRGNVANKTSLSDQQLADLIEVYPVESQVDRAFWETFREHSYQLRSCQTNQCVALAIDLNNDGVDEYILFEPAGDDQVYSYVHRKDKDDGFRRVYSQFRVKLSMTSLRQKLKEGSFQLVEPKWKDLKIGEQTLHTSSASN